MEMTMMTNVMDGTRGRGKQLNRWLYGVKMGHIEKGATIQQAERCVQDRGTSKGIWNKNAPTPIYEQLKGAQVDCPTSFFLILREDYTVW